MDSSSRIRTRLPTRWVCTAVCPVDLRHRSSCYPLCSLLPLRAGQHAALLCDVDSLYDCDAGYCAVREPDSTLAILGTDQHQLLLVDQLLESQERSAQRCSHGTDHYWNGWFGFVCRHFADRPGSRQLQPDGCIGSRGSNPWL